MKRLIYSCYLLTATVMLLAFCSPLTAQKVVFVASDGSGDGTSWENAAGDLQNVIAASDSGTYIWLKAGTYYGTKDTVVIMKNGVSLIGGFVGTETSAIQRTDFLLGGTNATTISGDYDKDGVTNAGNANTVIYGKGIGEETVLDGLIITGGYADDVDDGAGLRLSDGSPLVQNCVIYDNYCGDNGAGFYIASASLPVFESCYIIKNYAADKGGGGYTATACDATFSNCVFSNNSAVNDGPAVRIYKSSPTFMNCTFTRNSLPESGDGSAIEINNSASAPVFTNCVFWGNTENGALDEDIKLTTDGTVSLTNCALEGTYTSTGATVTGVVDISSTDPLFVNTSGTAGNNGYDANANWDIQVGSVLIDAGLETGAPDMDIRPAFRDDHPDIGAYENGATSPYIVALKITGSGKVNPAGAYVKPGNDQAFVITPAAGYEITSASFDGSDVLSSLFDNGDGSFSYTATAVSKNALLDVVFEALAVEYTLSFSAGTGGSINPTDDMSVTVTDVIAVTITPDASFVFADLLLNDVSVKDAVDDNGDGTYSYSLTGIGENSTLVASFSELFTVTITAGANGSVNPSGTIDVTNGMETVFTFSANSGYILETCTLDGADIMAEVTDNRDATYSYTLSNVDADVTLAVSFIEIVSEIVYVKTDGSGDGSSWETATGDLQAAIDAGELGDEIWVAKGTYIVPQDTSFTLKSGVSLYGGFAGNESELSARKNFRMGEANETKLSADVDGNGFLTGGNAPRVIYGEFISALTTIDGFTITGGNSDADKSNGAGMKLKASSPNVLNCTFYDNYCDDGAGLYLYRSDDDLSNPLVMNCYFMKCWANDDGGAVYNASGTGAQFVNCIFANNMANDEGGAVRNFECSPTFMNCDFIYNSLPDVDPAGKGTYGPAIRNYQTSSPYMNTEPNIVNCVFWMNVDGTSEACFEISNTGNMATAGVFANVVNCAVMDSISATSSVIIDTLDITKDNPGFMDVSGSAGYTGYNATSNWRIEEGSVLIDEGTNTENGVPQTDIVGYDRGATIDIGAFEYNPTYGINESTYSFVINVYPNPSSGSFIVELEQGIIHGAIIYDLSGRIVHKIFNDRSDDHLEINFQGRSGIYLMNILRNDGLQSASKIIIE